MPQVINRLVERIKPDKLIKHVSRSIALDPTSGFMFFTKYGHSAPKLERADLDGSNRTALVESKIVYPSGKNDLLFSYSSVHF